tara:strand:+ start:727 stop:2151 length:1425 start_codon:yes stop_codon:yes gene_type:complete
MKLTKTMLKEMILETLDNLHEAAKPISIAQLQRLQQAGREIPAEYVAQMPREVLGRQVPSEVINVRTADGNIQTFYRSTGTGDMLDSKQLAKLGHDPNLGYDKISTRFTDNIRAGMSQADASDLAHRDLGRHQKMMGSTRKGAFNPIKSTRPFPPHPYYQPLWFEKPKPAGVPDHELAKHPLGRFGTQANKDAANLLNTSTFPSMEKTPMLTARQLNQNFIDTPNSHTAQAERMKVFDTIRSPDYAKYPERFGTPKYPAMSDAELSGELRSATGTRVKHNKNVRLPDDYNPTMYKNSSFSVGKFDPPKPPKVDVPTPKPAARAAAEEVPTAVKAARRLPGWKGKAIGALAGVAAGYGLNKAFASEETPLKHELVDAADPTGLYMLSYDKYQRPHSTGQGECPPGQFGPRCETPEATERREAEEGGWAPGEPHGEGEGDWVEGEQYEWPEEEHLKQKPEQLDEMICYMLRRSLKL